MNLPERITDLEAQLKHWQERRTQASDALQEAQVAVLQLQGALAFARTLSTPDPLEDGLLGPMPSTLPPERCT